MTARIGIIGIIGIGWWATFMHKSAFGFSISAKQTFDGRLCGVHMHQVGGGVNPALRVLAGRVHPANVNPALPQSL